LRISGSKSRCHDRQVGDRGGDVGCALLGVRVGRWAGEGDV